MAYELTSTFKDDYSKLIIIHNANREQIKIVLPEPDEWRILANEFEVDKTGVSKGIKLVLMR